MHNLATEQATKDNGNQQTSATCPDCNKQSEKAYSLPPMVSPASNQAGCLAAGCESTEAHQA
jgi:hypothetical protein